RDPDERQRPQTKKENELDPNAQLEKPTLSTVLECCDCRPHTGHSLHVLDFSSCRGRERGRSVNSLRLRQYFFS
ncbi:hypothetical protein, partial [uncultured Roseobacter sp.]|uniref:hypothetical protein n=1 Tax=uncultured Roseobacter sp. TaxID=114847 RepID=UPI00262F841D